MAKCAASSESNPTSSGSGGGISSIGEALREANQLDTVMPTFSRRTNGSVAFPPTVLNHSQLARGWRTNQGPSVGNKPATLCTRRATLPGEFIVAAVWPSSKCSARDRRTVGIPAVAVQRSLVGNPTAGSVAGAVGHGVR
jgi:hypothetical protein